LQYFISAITSERLLIFFAVNYSNEPIVQAI